jgi:hypothetical protein
MKNVSKSEKNTVLSTFSCFFSKIQKVEKPSKTRKRVQKKPQKRLSYTLDFLGFFGLGTPKCPPFWQNSIRDFLQTGFGQKPIRDFLQVFLDPLPKNRFFLTPFWPKTPKSGFSGF